MSGGLPARLGGGDVYRKGRTKPPTKKRNAERVEIIKLSHIFHELRRIGAEQMAIAQAILDAQTKLDASIQALTAAVQADLASHAGAVTPAEQQTIADGISKSAAAVDALTASIPTT